MKPFYALRDSIQARVPAALVRLAFMEFAKPTFADAVADLHGERRSEVLVVPIFLSGGGHVAHDIPVLIEPEAARHPEMKFRVSGALGEEPEVVAAMADAVVRLSRG